MEQSKGRRLILFPVPLPGHVIPMLELANLLHFKGFSITIVHTHFNKLNPSSYPHLTFHLIDEGLSESEASTKDIAHLLTLLDQKCAEPLKECLISLLSDDSKEPVACLITEYRFYFTQSLAESLKLPRLLLRTGGASSLAVYIAFPLMREKGYYPKQDSQLEEPVKEFPPLKVKDLPTIKTKQNPEQFFQMTASRLIDEANASHGVIINTFEDIEGKALIRLRDELSAPIFGVGPFHKPFPTTGSSGPGCTLNLPQDQSCISWLNTQAPNSVIYVGFGSLATISEEQFLELAWGLANSNQPFLWVVRSEFVQGSKWLEALPDKLLETLYGKGHIVKWAPQKAVLAHSAVGAFWTHSGWNSTLECISEGVPMICMPCSADQMINARYVSDVWKVGLQLEHGRERGEIEKTIRRLMVEKEGEEIRQNMSNLKEKADLCFKPGGSSYECLEGLVRHILSLEAWKPTANVLQTRTEATMNPLFGLNG
ncbi:PREDICTED: UDP-glycosyltransferase 76C4-like [Fragaria vesca subsp. vesca]|uniref:UDP-glycosyltransferase 76C4-like n=1 Tax=Fragaria vesca subsp. vesca TaxID=101020 RepID=UPI0002C35458|nr:PREDICTED: UDP-glycosyltransferase 76C4-like [Fragaria vesca subsp. vesca]